MVATRGLDLWLEKLASIMQLKISKPNGHPKLIFTRVERGKKGYPKPMRSRSTSIGMDIPMKGWKPLDLGALTLWSHEDVPQVICEIGPEKDDNLDIMRMWLALEPIYQRVQESGGLPLHAALVERQGRSVLLAASGGGGKSTCCHRLPPPWRARCDDETLIVRDGKGKYFAHPLPTWSDHLWRGSNHTWNVQQSSPLATIFFLEQAQTDEAILIGEGTAAAFINKSATEVCRRNWKNLDPNEIRTLKIELFENACELAKALPAFKLHFSLKGRFWEEMERVLSEIV